MTASILPFVHAQGSWGEIGLQVGRMLAPSIERHVEAWTAHVVAETGCARAAVAVAAGQFASPIQEHAAFLWEELEGLARGSGVPVARLLILQARAEVRRAVAAVPPVPDLELECTSFAVAGPRAGGATFIGQNVDLAPFLEEFGVVVRQHPRDAPAALLYTTAGLLGHNGMNEAGVGVCANFIDDPAGWGEGLPRYLLSRLALRETCAEAARAAALAPPRAASRNLLIADEAGTLLDVEALRREAAVLRDVDGLLVHANHLEAPAFAGYETPAENSLTRRARLSELLRDAPSPLTVADVQGFYRDHAHTPHSLCAHPYPGRNLKTVVSMIGDLTHRELHVAKGPPCGAPYASYTLATCRTGALSVTVRDGFSPARTH
jgi:isopenicillin-N N-acyltransferase-like protein